MVEPIKTLDADIKAQSLDIRTDVELVAIKESLTAKIPRVTKDLKEFRLFPDAKKKEIYESLIQAGEIEEEPEDATALSLANQSKVDAEFQSQLQFYTNKVAKLRSIVVLADKEIELRDAKLVVRSI